MMNPDAILKACKTFGGTLTAEDGFVLNWKGEQPPPAELARVIKLHKPTLWHKLRTGDKQANNASMVAFLGELVGKPDIVVWRGETFKVGEIAKRLVAAKQTNEWFHESGKLWLAWHADDAAWYADSESMQLCERIGR